jgi:hypothetical protein
VKQWIATIKYVNDDKVPVFTVERKAEFLNALAGRCAVLALSEEYLTVTFSLPSPDCEVALSAAKMALDDAFASLGAAPPTVIKCELIEEEHAKAEDSITPDYLGVAEVAKLLGVTKQRIVQLSRTKGFPACDFKLAATPVWRSTPVLDFQKARQETRS